MAVGFQSMGKGVSSPSHVLAGMFYAAAEERGKGTWSKNSPAALSWASVTLGIFTRPAERGDGKGIILEVTTGRHQERHSKATWRLWPSLLLVCFLFCKSRWIGLQSGTVWMCPPCSCFHRPFAYLQKGHSVMRYLKTHLGQSLRWYETALIWHTLHLCYRIGRRASWLLLRRLKERNTPLFKVSVFLPPSLPSR